MHNEGGELHTFTRVADFGGGCIPEVSGPLGLTPVPECAPVVPAPDGPIPAAFVTSGVRSGHDLTVNVDTRRAGTIKYMCLIHPWMRTVVTVG